MFNLSRIAALVALVFAVSSPEAEARCRRCRCSCYQPVCYSYCAPTYGCGYAPANPGPVVPPLPQPAGPPKE